MIGFYIEAITMDLTRHVELRVHRGTRTRREATLGSLAFDSDEWEAFRPIIVGGMRAASYLRIPVEFMDQTRKKPLEIQH